MPNPHLNLPYTIGFCIAGDKVLLLHRNSAPNQGKWNGLGGKIESGESPEQANAREIMEEAELDVTQANSVHFVGVVTWTVVGRDSENDHKGMYAYVIRFSDAPAWQRKTSDEGLLEWKSLDWAKDKANTEVVDNIPHFLPHMLNSTEPVRYHCQYNDGHLDGVDISPLVVTGGAIRQYSGQLVVNNRSNTDALLMDFSDAKGHVSRITVLAELLGKDQALQDFLRSNNKSDLSELIDMLQTETADLRDLMDKMFSIVKSSTED